MVEHHHSAIESVRMELIHGHDAAMQDIKKNNKCPDCRNRNTAKRLTGKNKQINNVSLLKHQLCHINSFNIASRNALIAQ
jgi:hypothetical protein